MAQHEGLGHSPVRASIAFGVACNAALTVILVDRLTPGITPLGHAASVRMLAAVAAAVGFAAFAAGLHDLMDLSPRRPGSRPRLSTAQGTIVSIGGLILAFLGARYLGGDSLDVTLVLAGLTLFYNAVARFIPGIGLLVPGALVAGVMLIPQWRMGLSPAVWLVMTIAVMVTIGVYLLENTRPVLSRRATAAVVSGWIVMSGIILSLRAVAGEASPWMSLGFTALLWPLGAVVVLAVLVRWTLAATSDRHIAARKLLHWVSLWQPVLAASWCAAIGAWVWATVLGSLGVAVLLIIGGLRDLGIRRGTPTWR